MQLNYIVLVRRDEGKTAADYSSYGQAVLPDMIRSFHSQVVYVYYEAPLDANTLEYCLLTRHFHGLLLVNDTPDRCFELPHTHRSDHS